MFGPGGEVAVEGVFCYSSCILGLRRNLGESHILMPVQYHSHHIPCSFSFFIFHSSLQSSKKQEKMKEKLVKKNNY